MSPKKKKPAKPHRPRNPFAGHRKSGAGFHEEKKYGKKERRDQARELEELADEETGEATEPPAEE
jgi:hypothetical protein